MSGIVGVLNLDGAPVQATIISPLTEFLRFRGPDANNIWINGSLAFGHTLLETHQSGNERQPYSLDGKSWIVADTHIVDRNTLITDLRSRGQVIDRDAPDCEVILRAYHLWQEHCVEHLLGDFAFAIWDAKRRRLFAARDHMGVKPLYYSLVGPWFIFSNTLDCVRQHPAVSDRLNELALADFLISGLNEQVDTTFFADINRLPPAHALTLSAADGLNIRRYWQLPVDEPVYYQRAEDYVEQFRDLLKTTVNDRLSPGPIGIFMSGGLDSTAIAATVAAAGNRYSPQAFTSVYDHVIPDDERHYSGLVASYLRIPIHYHVRDEEPIGLPVIHTPEPVLNPLLLNAENLYWRELSSFSRVFFYGEGPDNALYFEWLPHFRYLIRGKRWLRVFSDLASDTVIHRRVPFASRVGKLFNRSTSRAKSVGEFPDWINKDFAQRLKLKDRRDQLELDDSELHPLRPKAYRSLTSILWPEMFEKMDASWTGVPIEVRHPLADIRLLRFMLSVPTIPWCRGKCLLRRALRGMIPEPVRSRPKTGLYGDPFFELIRSSNLCLPDLPTETIGQYADPRKLPEAGSDPDALSINLRLSGLNYWLESLESKIRVPEVSPQYRINEEDLNGFRRRARTYFARFQESL